MSAFRFTLLCTLAVALLLPVAAFSGQWDEKDPGHQDQKALDTLKEKGTLDEETYNLLSEQLSYKNRFIARPTGLLVATFTPYNQMKYDEVVTYPGSPDELRGFALQEAEFGLKGQMYYDWLKFKMVANGETLSDGTYTFGLKYAQVSGAYVPTALKGGSFVPSHGLTIGAMKIPFSRQSLVSSGKLQFIDRSIVISEMPIRYDVGSTFDASYNIAEDMVNIGLRIGAFNGQGNRVYAADNNDNLQYTGRLVVDLLGPFAEGEGDQANDRKSYIPQFSFGASMLQNNDIDRIVKAYGFDAELRWWGLSLSGEYITTNFEPDFAENTTPDIIADDWETQGWYVQGGMFVWTHHIELAVRYEEFMQDLLNDKQDDQIVSATTAGANFYLASQHRLKLMADYTMRTEVDGIPELDNDTFSLAAAFNF